jgi:DNA repair protein RadB
MNYLKTNCESLDLFLNGGIEKGIITKLYGEAGSGKTNLCLQISRECANNGKKVAYIDTEGVSIERLTQICSNHNFEDILSKIIFFNPSSMDEQESMIKEALKIKNLGLIIIDTINLYYRINLEDDKEASMRSFTRQIASLQINSRKKNFITIVVEQVFTDKNGIIKPFTNRDTEHMIKTIIKLDKIDIGVRQATLIKHRSEPEEKKAIFKITQKGLE